MEGRSAGRLIGRIQRRFLRVLDAFRSTSGVLSKGSSLTGGSTPNLVSSVPQFFAALDFLSCQQATNRADANEHEVSKSFHEKFRQGLVYPSINGGFRNCQYGASEKYPADYSEHELKIGHNALPFLGGTVSGQTKNRLKYGLLSAMGCPFADTPVHDLIRRKMGSKSFYMNGLVTGT
jgi:hypothetical protein